MKRELAYVLEEAKSQLGESSSSTSSSLGRTRATQTQTSFCPDGSEDFSCKRFKGSIVNGVIVYTRARKLRNNNAREDDNVERVKLAPCTTADEAVEGELVEVVVEEASNGNFGIFKVQDELQSEVQPSPATAVVDGGTVEVPVFVAEKHLPQEALRRFTRSAVRVKVETVVSSADGVKNELVSNLDGEESTVGVSGSAGKKNKLELKMSKKIALNKKPTTVKELFDTGLVDGVPVVYMGGKKVIFNTRFVVFHFFFLPLEKKLSGAIVIVSGIWSKGHNQRWWNIVFMCLVQRMQSKHCLLS